MEIDLNAIQGHIKGHPPLRGLIHDVLLLDHVDSTNRMALEMAGSGMPPGIVLLADSQHKGRGRMGREWFSPKGINLYLSLYLRPYQSVREFPLFSMATAMALLQAIDKVTSLAAEVKWPNDIFIGPKKVCGILLESISDGGQAPPLVIGIGVNVNGESFPKRLAATATSLKIAAGIEVDRTGLAIAILSAMAEQFDRINAGETDLLMEELRQHCQTLGKWVRVVTPRQEFEGYAEDIAHNGALILKMGDGSQRQIYMGDIVHLYDLPRDTAKPIYYL